MVMSPRITSCRNGRRIMKPRKTDAEIYAKSFGINLDHTEDLLKECAILVTPRAFMKPWFYQHGEAGDFEILSRAELIYLYFETRLAENDAEDIGAFRPADSFRIAKREVVSFFIDWSDQIKGALALARRTRKSRRLRRP